MVKHRKRIIPATLVSGISVLFLAVIVGAFSEVKQPPTSPSILQPDETGVMANVTDGPVSQVENEVSSTLPSEETASEVIPLPTLPVIAVEKEPTLVERAAAALAQNDFQRALELLEANPVGAGGENPEGVGLYAQALVGRAEELMKISPEEAEALLVQATEVAPMMVEPHIMLGKRYTHRQEYPKAIDAYQKAVGLDPAASDAFFNLGFIYAATGKFEDAEKAFQQVVSLKPAYVDKSLFNLAVVQQKLGKKAQSIANLEEVVAMKPENKRALAYLNQLRRSDTADSTEQIR